MKRKNSRKKQVTIRYSALKCNLFRTYAMRGTKPDAWNGDDSYVLLLDWLEQMKLNSEKTARESGRTYTNTSKSKASLIYHIRNFIELHRCGKGIKVVEVDLAFCNEFSEYLKTLPKRLSTNTRSTYFKHFSAALNAAVRSGIIPRNPVVQMEVGCRPRQVEVERAYLTAEEMRSLHSTLCTGHPEVKSAFLFSCMCGLRWSDIKFLVWDMLKNDGDVWHIELRMAKTRELLYLPLCREAALLLPPRKEFPGHQPIFDLPSLGCANKAIKRWVADAGVAKKITFHNARHTFGTMLITLGADLYTTSKLLGHSSIKVTQIYAKIVDKKKEDAVNLFNGIFRE